jgi:hypothetical protein
MLAGAAKIARRPLTRIGRDGAISLGKGRRAYGLEAVNMS